MTAKIAWVMGVESKKKNIGTMDNFLSKLVSKQQNFSMKVLHFAGEEGL